jgi:hypothetical protein
MQVDCAWCIALMTGSPHTSMPIATHHFKPQPFGWGFFMFRTNGMPRSQGCEGAAPPRLARRFDEHSSMCTTNHGIPRPQGSLN